MPRQKAEGEEIKMKLSLIICVYNTSPELLTECLDSVFAEVGAGELEVVMVDDGSTVDYSPILEKYPVKYSKIENRGHLGARLHGISVASGDYIGFVDSDDTVSKNYHAPMLELAEKSGADIVINGWAFHTDRTKRICTRDTSMSRVIDARGEECIRLFTSQRGKEHSYYVLWNKIYRRELFLRALDELTARLGAEKRITNGEDALLNFFCFKNAKLVKNVNSGLYFYRIHSSQSVVVTSEEKLASQINCMSLVFDIMLDELTSASGAEESVSDVAEWQGLIARSHYATAKTQKYTSLYPMLKERYRQAALALPHRSDGECYERSELLGDNFEHIDAALTELYYRDKPVEAFYDRRSIYASRAVDSVKRVRGEVRYSRRTALTVPKRKIKLRDRIIHNPAVYRIGLILFRKGSRLRGFLKKHL